MITITTQQASSGFLSTVVMPSVERNFIDSPVITLDLTPEMVNMNKDAIHAAAWVNIAQENCPFLAAMRTVMSAMQNTVHWKKPFGVINPKDEHGNDLRNWVDAASQWFHASEAVCFDVYGDGKTVVIWNNGYAA